MVVGCREAIQKRYALLPYIYTTFQQSHEDGSPIMRPLWYPPPLTLTQLTKCSPAYNERSLDRSSEASARPPCPIM